MPIPSSQIVDTWTIETPVISPCHELLVGFIAFSSRHSLRKENRPFEDSKWETEVWRCSNLKQVTQFRVFGLSDGNPPAPQYYPFPPDLTLDIPYIQ